MTRIITVISNSLQRRRKEKGPRKRPRALTCPLPAEPEKSSRPQRWKPFKKSLPQQTHDQFQSALLMRLPGEIRQLIWAKVIGGHLLHMVHGPTSLVAIDCAEAVDIELETRRHLCWGFSTKDAPPSYLHPHAGHHAKPVNILPLLQTCRIIYTEAVSILYGDNIFDLNRVSTLISFHHSILPHRLNQIRVLNLTWDYATLISDGPIYYDLDSWLEACEVLSRFAGLQELTVHFNNWCKFSYPGADGKRQWGPLLEALRPAKAVKRFDIYLAWTEDECAIVAREGSYPFKLMPMANIL